MADQNQNPQKSQSNEPAKNDRRLQETAFKLFEHSRGTNASPEQVAIRCFRDASAFLRAADKIMSGEIDIVAIDNNPLDGAFAPNLKKGHPINLMSREWGSIKKVREALAMVPPNVEAVEELGWGLPECNQARALFPSVIEKADKLEAAAKS